MYDDVIKMAGGYGTYQRLASTLIICSYCMYYTVFYGLMYCVRIPDLVCIKPGDADYSECTEEEICNGNLPYQFAYSYYSDSYYNWYEQLDLLCHESKITQIYIALAASHGLSILLAPWYTELIGMKLSLIILTLLQSVACGFMMVSKNANFTIALVALCGMTGGRQAFSYILLAE